MNQVRTLSVSIKVPAQVVYPFVSDPANLPKWSLFVRTAAKEGDGWRVETHAGVAQMRFVSRNELGVVDHWVRPSNSPAEIYVPLRVVTNGAGSEVSFTVFRLPEMNDAAYEADLEMVRKDLSHLKAVLEAKPA